MYRLSRLILFVKHGARWYTASVKTKQVHVVRGIISVNSKGTGFVTPASDTKAKRKRSENDTEVPPERLNCALHGDEVEARLTGEKSKYGHPLGEVARVTKRAKEKFVGVVTLEKGAFFIRPDDWRCYTDFTITPAQESNEKEGDKVFFRMRPWVNPKRAPQADILEVIGRAGEHNAEMKALALARGFSSSFPPAVEHAAGEIKKRYKEIFAGEIPKRRDMRNATTFTIDPADAKDFDDALSLTKMPNGHYEIGVHIADVAFFVRENTLLDEEARERGNSVYLVDRTIPMLPEVLSNDLCSLNPNEDKYTFSAVFEIDERARVLSRWFGRTIIRSQKRFTYEEAQKVIEAKSGILAEELLTLNRLAKLLREQNRAAGAIDFETEEVKFELDEKGSPLRIYKKERLDTHKLVENWMLLANREVAEFLAHTREKKAGKSPALYRIHDLPDSDKIAELALFARALGHHLPITGKSVTGKDLQQLFKKIEGEAEEALIKTTALRSMAKAIYSTKNIGHFGLAMSFYTHFTSPIRRYADLLVHRMLARRLVGEEVRSDEWTAYERIAEHITEKEIAAAEAERESVKMKQVEYMAERIGQVFEGAISGVTEWGVYVEERETKAEGMAALRNFEDDFYTLDEKHYRIVGSRTGAAYALGDKVRFKVIGADTERKTLDMQVIGRL